MAYGIVSYQDLLAQGAQGGNPTSGSRSVSGYIGGAPASTTASSNPAVINPGTYNANFAALYPNLSATQGQASANTLAHLQGNLSPETLNAIQDTAARFGISSGMPLGSGGNSVTGNFGRRLVGQTVEGLQSQGLQDYLNTLKSYSGTLMPTTGELIGADTSKYATDTGAATSRYATDVGAQTASNSLGQQAYQFGLTFPESQRQFDITSNNQQRQFDTSSYLQNQQANNQLGLGYAGLGQNYLNSYLQFLQ